MFRLILTIIVIYIIVSAIFNARSRRTGRSGGCLNMLFLGSLFNRPPRPPRNAFGGGYRGGFGARPPRAGGFGSGRSSGSSAGGRVGGSSRSGGSSGGRVGGSRSSGSSFGSRGSSRGGSFGGGSSRGGGASRKF